MGGAVFLFTLLQIFVFIRRDRFKRDLETFHEVHYGRQGGVQCEPTGLLTDISYIHNAVRDRQWKHHHLTHHYLHFNPKTIKVTF